MLLSSLQTSVTGEVAFATHTTSPQLANHTHCEAARRRQANQQSTRALQALTGLAWSLSRAVNISNSWLQSIKQATRSAGAIRSASSWQPWKSGRAVEPFRFVRYERSSDCVKVSDSSVSYASAFAVLQ
ncbi:hypothetical protein MRB53_037569 [Persea americana]|nr:hypothetical protein MRB53_037569 [Persea americana]